MHYLMIYFGFKRYCLGNMLFDLLFTFMNKHVWLYLEVAVEYRNLLNIFFFPDFFVFKGEMYGFPTIIML